MTIDKQALRKAAIAATGGKWVFSRSGANSNVQAPIELQKGGRALVVLCKLNNAGWSGQIQTENNAKFIAVANPETVLALLDELEAAEHTAAVNHEAACSLVEENEEVKRKLAAAEKRIADYHRALNNLASVARRYLPDYDEHPDIQAADDLLENAATHQGSQLVSNRDELLPSIKPAPELDSVAKNAKLLPSKYPVIPDEVLSAIRKVARIRTDFDHFDGDRRGIADCLDEAEQELIVTINEHAAMLLGAPVQSSMPDGVVTAEHRRVIEMLLNVCGAAFELADDSCQQDVDGEECHVVPDDAFQKLSDALDEIENTLPTEDVDRPDVFLAWSAMPRAALKSILQAGNSPVIPDGLADTKRLDWLDAQNKRLNEYYGTSYGWKFDANFQRNAMMLNDSNYPVMTVRQAIDQAITAAPQQENT
ncbi:TPA: ead/Ea22-like family protein [Citrobacter farmeri]